MARSSKLKEFGARHHFGLTKIYEEINSGDLRIYKIGKLTRISDQAEADWLRLKEEQSPQAREDWRQRIKKQTQKKPKRRSDQDKDHDDGEEDDGEPP